MLYYSTKKCNYCKVVSVKWLVFLPRLYYDILFYFDVLLVQTHYKGCTLLFGMLYNNYVMGCGKQR